MYAMKRKSSLALVLIVLIVLGSLSASKQETRLFSQMTDQGAITSQISDNSLEAGPVRREGSEASYGALQRTHRMACRGLNSFRQLLMLGYSFLDGQELFSLSTVLHSDVTLLETSGHLKLIHFIYEKDGKK